MAENNDNPPSSKSVCIDVWIDGPGDTTPRPVTGSRLEQLKKEREKIYGSPEPGPVPPEVLARAMSLMNTVDVWIDGPGDTTPRPATGSHLERLRKEREKLFGSPEPGPVPPEMLDRLLDVNKPLPRQNGSPPKDSDKTGHG